ncbi:hypothetical protein [Vreelandella venusta]|uniref:hypothetical protein n=1 Tax=Vreelandella venusta TaxID=44935 RepID=UPI00200D7BEC|nr:hypothetical protein [Halomonas venusta]UQI41910.1 hypothetical protein M3L73_06530 [Halomonas venusta]
MTKPFILAVLLLVGVVLPTWLAPVTEGGLANLANFVAWASGLLVLALALLDLWLGSAHDEPVHVPTLIRWTFRLAWWSAVLWAAYHGLYALAALHTVSALLIRFSMTRKELSL